MRLLESFAKAISDGANQCAPSAAPTCKNVRCVPTGSLARVRVHDILCVDGLGQGGAELLERLRVQTVLGQTLVLLTYVRM